MDGNLPGMMIGVVPAPVPKVPRLLRHRASRQRAHGVDGVVGMMTTMIGKAGRAGEVVDITRKRKIAVGTVVSIVAQYYRSFVNDYTNIVLCICDLTKSGNHNRWGGRDLTVGMGDAIEKVTEIEEEAMNEALGTET